MKKYFLTTFSNSLAVMQLFVIVDHEIMKILERINEIQQSLTLLQNTGNFSVIVKYFKSKVVGFKTN